MNTPLRTAMSDDQFAALVEHVVLRTAELFTALKGSRYWVERELFEKRAQGDYSSRVAARDADPRDLTIFDQRNASLRPVATVNGFLEARICRDAFGTSPWLALKPQGKMDAGTVKQAAPYVMHKLKQALFTTAAKDAIATVLDLGDCPVKVSWEVRTDEAEENKIVLVDVRTGQPVTDADGQFIVPETPTEETVVPVLGEDGAPGVDVVGEPLVRNATMFAGGVEFLPAAHEWREMTVPVTTRIYNGLRIDPVDWKGFVFPIDQPRLQNADLVAVRTNIRLSTLRQMVQGKKREPGEALPPGELPFSEEIEARLLELQAQNKNKPQGEHGDPRAELGEAALESPQGDPLVSITEAYGEFDCLGDGVKRRFFMILDEERKLCFWVDYRRALNPWAKMPVFMLAIHRPRNRAYGIGHYKMYQMLEDLSDEQLNSILRANEWAVNPIKVVNRQKLVVEQQSAEFEITPGAELNPADGTVRPEDVVDTVKWPDRSERAWELMQLPMQIIQTWSGVTNAAQAAVSNLPGNDLATGINALAEVASVLHIHLLSQITQGLEEVLSFAVETLFLRQDTDETFEFLEGEADQVMLLSDAEKLRKLPLNVEITLTRAKRQEDKEAALAAIPVAMQYGTLPPVEQMRMKGMFEQALTGLGFSHPEQFLLTTDEILAGLVQQLTAEGWQIFPPGAPLPMPTASAAPPAAAPVEAPAPAAAEPATPAPAV